MPVRWDAVKDQYILVTIMTDPAINIPSATFDRVADSWPASFGEPPTRRAIGEHIKKLRQSLGFVSTPASTHNASNAVKSTSGKNADDSEPPVTPINRGTKRKSPVGTKTSHSQSKKRKKGPIDSDEAEAESTDDASEVDVADPQGSPGTKVDCLRSKKGRNIIERLREAQTLVDVGTDGEKSVEVPSQDDSDGSVFQDLPPL